jgi:hypothetical protein
MKTSSKVIIRANESGVWYGELADHAPDWSWVLLRGAIRLWQWQTVEGVSCSALAANGIDKAKSVLAPMVDEVIVLNPCEVIAVSPKAEASYEN